MGLDNPIHLALLLMIMLLVFGAKRLPEMGRSMGDGLRGFKEAVNKQTALPTEDTAPVAAPTLAGAPTPVAAPVLAVVTSPAATQEPVSHPSDLTPTV